MLPFTSLPQLTKAATRTSRQLRRMACYWVSAAFPRRTVPIKHIPSSSLPSRRSLSRRSLSSSICLAEQQSSRGPLLPARSLPLRRSGSINSQVSYLPPAQALKQAAAVEGQGYATAATAAATVVDESPEPIIVAASWLGAKQRPFSKYKQLWQSLGFSRLLSARPPMATIVVPAAGQLLAAQFTHKLLQTARQYPNAPILVHLFSGGGFIFMGWVLQMLGQMESAEGRTVINRIRGVIFDSSPADVTADVSSRALIAAALGRSADGIEDELPWLVKPTAAVVDGYLKLPFIREALVEMEEAWLREAPACPKLFLYSDADVLIDPGVVEGFMQQQQAKGSQTYSYKWHDSAHVDHYRKYPQEYKQQLQIFVQQVLGQQQQAGEDMV